MRKYLRIVDQHRATKWLRFFNFIIDRIVIYILFFLFGAFSLLVFEIFNIDFFLNITDKMATANRFDDILITTLTYLLYLFLMEYFAKGRTVGKFITGTKVISVDGTNPTIQQLLIRTVSRIVPFDFLSFFGENGWHDSWSDTRVINIKNYEAEKQTKSDIEDLGKKEIA